MTNRPAMFPLQEHIGMTISSEGTGLGRAELTLTASLHNPNGVVHGAVLFAMVDTAMGAATMSVLDESAACASIEVHLRFLRAASSGSLVADVSVVKAGSRVVQLEGRVVDDADNLIATATGSFAVIPGRGTG